MVYYKELKHSYYGRRIIDLSPGPGNFLAATWEETPPTPYIGVCFGPSHQAELMEHAVDQYLVKMATEGHAVYNKDYAKFKNESASSSGTGAAVVVVPPNGLRRASGKRIAANAAARAAAAADIDDEAAGDDGAPGAEDPPAAAAAASGGVGGAGLEALLASI